MKHKLEGVCSKGVSFSVDGGKLTGVKFYKGCPGNLKAVCRLLEGVSVKTAIAKLKGIRCGERATSCTDQLSRVLERLNKKV